MPSRARITSHDPFLLGENVRNDAGLWDLNRGYNATSGKTLRSSPSINTGIRNLVYIINGQSNECGVATTSYTPTNASAVDNFNVYDGGMYAAAGVLLGAGWLNTSLGSTSLGCLATRVADTLITNNKFDRVIIVPIAIGGTSEDMRTNGVTSNRHIVAMRRLASRGIVPGLANTTFIYDMNGGESDNGITSQATFTALRNAHIAQMIAAGFSGRMFSARQSRNAGVNDTNITNAQAAVADGVNVFVSENVDAITTGRYADGTHTNDSAIIARASAKVAAFAASGAPF